MLRLVLLATLLVTGCGKSKYDVFMEGQKIEGEAERGICHLHYADDSPAAVINGDMVQECLAETNKAIELYEKAGEMGYDDVDYQQVLTRAKERRERLESMLKMVRKMERDQDLEKQPQL